MRLLNLVWSYLRIGIANELQYRVNFFIQLLQSLVALATGLIGLWLVFRNIERLPRPGAIRITGVVLLYLCLEAILHLAGGGGWASDMEGAATFENAVHQSLLTTHRYLLPRSPVRAVAV